MLHPEMNGLHIRIFNSNSNGQEMYFVDEGKARQFTQSDTFDRMFNNNTRLFDLTFDHNDMIDIGSSMNGSQLINYDGNYYMWDEGKNRHIADPATMNRCGFNWDGKKGIVDPTKFPGTLGRPVQWIPKFNGNRVKTPNDPAIYLIDKGTKRHILDPGTYNSLFGSNPAQIVQSLDDIPSGPDITSSTTKLVKADDQPGGAHTYLLDQGYKRMITGKYAMEYIGYGFEGGHVTNMSWFYLSEYLDGSPIVWPEHNNVGTIRD